MITIAKDATFINSIINDPIVHKGACPLREGEVEDLSFAIDNDDFLILEAKPYGGFLLHKNDYDSYVVHTMFLSDTPSSTVRKSVRDAMYVMYIELDALEIQSSACRSNVPASRLMKSFRFHPLFTKPSRYVSNSSEQFGTVTINDYILATEDFKILGESFHELVKDTTNHADDEVHDYYVGAAVALIRAGNMEKAVRVYNKWAILTGFIPMTIEDDVITLGDMTITLDETKKDIKEVVCQQGQ